MWVRRQEHEALRSRVNTLEAKIGGCPPVSEEFYKAHPDCTHNGRLHALFGKVTALYVAVEKHKVRIGEIENMIGRGPHGLLETIFSKPLNTRMGEVETRLCALLRHLKLRVAGPTPGGQLIKDTTKEGKQ